MPERATGAPAPQGPKVERAIEPNTAQTRGGRRKGGQRGQTGTAPPPAPLPAKTAAPVETPEDPPSTEEVKTAATPGSDS